MAQRMVKCAKLGRELPGLEETPFDGPDGERIYNSISQEAWNLWANHLKMIINEYRLNPGTLEAQDIIKKHMDDFLFGEGGQLPAEYVPPSQKSSS